MSVMASETSKFHELESKCETLYVLFYGGKIPVYHGVDTDGAESILMKTSNLLGSILGKPESKKVTLEELLVRVHEQLMAIRDCVMGVGPQEHDTLTVGVDTLIHEANVTICFLRQRTARDSNCVLS